jgi:hypothetical protein
MRERHVGIDETKGRYADVTLERCTRCRRLWLSYTVEYEAISNSGRWAMAPIAEADAALTPEAAVRYIESADSFVFGGSYFGHAGKRGSGRIAHWLWSETHWQLGTDVQPPDAPTKPPHIENQVGYDFASVQIVSTHRRLWQT